MVVLVPFRPGRCIVVEMPQFLAAGMGDLQGL